MVRIKKIKNITINEVGEERRDRNENLEAISSSVQCCAQSHYTKYARGIFTERNVSIGKKKTKNKEAGKKIHLSIFSATNQFLSEIHAITLNTSYNN